MVDDLFQPRSGADKYEERSEPSQTAPVFDSLALFHENSSQIDRMTTASNPAADAVLSGFSLVEAKPGGAAQPESKGEAKPGDGAAQPESKGDAKPGGGAAQPESRGDAKPGGGAAQPESRGDATPGGGAAQPESKGDAKPGGGAAQPESRGNARPGGDAAQPESKGDAKPGVAAQPESKGDAKPGVAAQPESKGDAKPSADSKPAINPDGNAGRALTAQEIANEMLTGRRTPQGQESQREWLDEARRLHPEAYSQAETLRDAARQRETRQARERTQQAEAERRIGQQASEITNPFHMAMSSHGQARVAHLGTLARTMYENRNNLDAIAQHLARTNSDVQLRREGGAVTLERFGVPQFTFREGRTASDSGIVTRDNDRNREVRFNPEGRIFVTGTDGQPREFVNAYQYEQLQPGPPGGRIVNHTEHPILAVGNGPPFEGEQHGQAFARVIRPGQSTTPGSDYDGVVTHPDYQPLNLHGLDLTIMPRQVHPDASASQVHGGPWRFGLLVLDTMHVRSGRNGEVETFGDLNNLRSIDSTRVGEFTTGSRESNPEFPGWFLRPQRRNEPRTDAEAAPARSRP